MSDYYSDDMDGLPLFSQVNPACVIEKQQQPDDDSYAQKREEMLEALQRESLSCVDVETRWHRGQAVIGELRKRGHVINTVRGVYEYVGFRADMVKSKSLQELYYNTVHWKSTAKARKEFDGFRCVQCASSEQLETHHWRYNLFNEDMRDLTTLCRTCHVSLHDAVKGSGVHFPDYVTQEIAERILNNGTDN